jgi:hypothetical protein
MQQKILGSLVDFIQKEEEEEEEEEEERMVLLLKIFLSFHEALSNFIQFN